MMGPNQFMPSHQEQQNHLFNGLNQMQPQHHPHMNGGRFNGNQNHPRSFHHPKGQRRPNFENGPSMYSMPPPPASGNVYVNNMTANVNMPGCSTPQFPPPQYTPRFTPQCIPEENENGTDEAVPTPAPAVSNSTRGSRRGRGRGRGGYNNVRRNGYVPEQHHADLSDIKPIGYQEFYFYPPQFNGGAFNNNYPGLVYVVPRAGYDHSPAEMNPELVNGSGHTSPVFYEPMGMYQQMNGMHPDPATIFDYHRMSSPIPNQGQYPIHPIIPEQMNGMLPPHGPIISEFHPFPPTQIAPQGIVPPNGMPLAFDGTLPYGDPRFSQHNMVPVINGISPNEISPYYVPPPLSPNDLTSVISAVPIQQIDPILSTDIQPFVSENPRHNVTPISDPHHQMSPSDSLTPNNGGEAVVDETNREIDPVFFEVPAPIVHDASPVVIEIVEDSELETTNESAEPSQQKNNNIEHQNDEVGPDEPVRTHPPRTDDAQAIVPESNVVLRQPQEDHENYQPEIQAETPPAKEAVNEKHEIRVVTPPVQEDKNADIGPSIEVSLKPRRNTPKIQAAQIDPPATTWASLFKASATQAHNPKPVAAISPFESAKDEATSATTTVASNLQSRSSPNSRPTSSTEHHRSSDSKETIAEWSAKLAEFLSKYKVNFGPVNLRPRGLANRFNCCFMNAILQALVTCSPFTCLINSMPKPGTLPDKSSTPTIEAMIQLVSEFSSVSGLRSKNNSQKKGGMPAELSCGKPFEPDAIYKLWSAARPEFNEGRQEDAEEFLGFVLNRLNDEMLEVMKSVDHSEQSGSGSEEADDWQMIGNKRTKSRRRPDFGHTPISDIFRGELRTRLERECEECSDKIQPFFTLQLNIKNASSVQEALNIFVGRDQLEGLTCSKSNQKITAWQQMSLEKLPVVLILHLKWFDYKLDECTKIHKTVAIPLELRIDPKMLGSKKYSKKRRLYKLAAVVSHEGKAATNGHYFTDAFHTEYDQWLRYDDNTVKPVSEHSVLHPRAPVVPYLLYYRRCDTITSSQ